VPWIPRSFTGRPDAATTSASCRLSNPSQPSETSSAPPTFGCVQSFSIIQPRTRSGSTREADQVDVAVAESSSDLARDVVRIRPGERDQHVADALAAVGAAEASHRSLAGAKV
jgi:hypothetical protein